MVMLENRSKVNMDDNDSPCDEIGNDETYIPCFDIEPDPIPRPIIRQERVIANQNRLYNFELYLLSIM